MKMIDNKQYGYVTLELMEDNVKLCKERLAGPQPVSFKIWKILHKNIVCADALTYDYSFGEPVGIDKYFSFGKTLKSYFTGSGAF